MDSIKAMTTEGMPNIVWLPPICAGKISLRISHMDTQYTRTSWLIERLEGMKVIRRHGQDQRDLDYSLGSNDAIDAVIALVREG